jgi:hypothetical protein
LFDVEVDSIKLVFKGKILNDSYTAAGAKLSGGTVMVVINQVKK